MECSFCCCRLQHAIRWLVCAKRKSGGAPEKTERSRSPCTRATGCSSLLGSSYKRTVQRLPKVYHPPMFFLTFILTFGYFLANFERLVLGCIEADVCKEILNGRLNTLDEIYKIYKLLDLLESNRKTIKTLLASVLRTKHTAPEKKLSDRSSYAWGNREKRVHTCTQLNQRK